MARRLVASLLAAAAVLAGCGTLRAPATPGVVKVVAANLAAFDASLRPVEAVIASIRRRYPGAPVASTERVPGYLLQAAGLTGPANHPPVPPVTTAR